MPPFHLVIPPFSGRKRSRRPATGLSLTCTPVASTRLQAAGQRNLAIEIQDVGSGGVRFTTSEPLESASFVNLQIRDDRTGEVFLARGEVVWVDRRNDRHLVGTRFDEILTPPSQSAWFYDRWAPAPKGLENRTAAPERQPRAGRRFAPADCDVVLERDPRFRAKANPGNIATRLLDLSRSGAQVACSEPVQKLDRLRLTVNLRNFQDIFTAEAEVVWVRAAANRAWTVGLSFGSLNRAQERQLASLERWFGAR